MMAPAIEEDHLRDDLLLILDPGHPTTQMCERIQHVSNVQEIISFKRMGPHAGVMHEQKRRYAGSEEAAK